MKRHNENSARLGAATGATPDLKSSGKIRVGYLSTDFRDHPVGRLLPELFALHDRNTIEVIGYSLGVEDDGALRQRIRQACDSFVDLHHMSDMDAARRIQADNVDILVDLSRPNSRFAARDPGASPISRAVEFSWLARKHGRRLHRLRHRRRLHRAARTRDILQRENCASAGLLSAERSTKARPRCRTYACRMRPA